MDLRKFTHSQIHGALVEVLTEMEYHFAQLRVVLSGTDYLDGDRALDVVGRYNDFRAAYESLVRKSLNDLGISDEEIDMQIQESLKRFYGE